MIKSPRGSYRCAWCNKYMRHIDLKVGNYGTQEDIEGEGLICWRHHLTAADVRARRASLDSGVPGAGPAEGQLSMSRS